jgi:hypothetical protein
MFRRLQTLMGLVRLEVVKRDSTMIDYTQLRVLEGDDTILLEFLRLAGSLVIVLVLPPARWDTMERGWP